jgi:DNA-binding NarL/FixJ family response regulator
MNANQLEDIESERVRVAIVDDHDAIRLGFRGACQEYGFELLASAATVSDLLQDLDALASEAAEATCQVAVLDLSLADGSLVADNVN